VVFRLLARVELHDVLVLNISQNVSFNLHILLHSGLIVVEASDSPLDVDHFYCKFLVSVIFQGSNVDGGEGAVTQLFLGEVDVATNLFTVCRLRFHVNLDWNNDALLYVFLIF
jgi:hypothetical protein